MNRRIFLGLSSSVGVSIIAGCVGNAEEDFTLQVVDQELGENEEGYLVLNVTVSNPGNSRQTGIVEISARVNDEELVRLREVTLDPHQTTRVTIEYDVENEKVRNFRADASIRPTESE